MIRSGAVEHQGSAAAPPSVAPELVGSGANPPPRRGDAYACEPGTRSRTYPGHVARHRRALTPPPFRGAPRRSGDTPGLREHPRCPALPLVLPHPPPERPLDPSTPPSRSPARRGSPEQPRCTDGREPASLPHPSSQGPAPPGRQQVPRATSIAHHLQGHLCRPIRVEAVEIALGRAEISVTGEARCGPTQRPSELTMPPPSRARTTGRGRGETPPRGGGRTWRGTCSRSPSGEYSGRGSGWRVPEAGRLA